MFKNKMVMLGVLLSLGSVTLVSAVEGQVADSAGDAKGKKTNFTKVSEAVNSGFTAVDNRLGRYPSWGLSQFGNGKVRLGFYGAGMVVALAAEIYVEFKNSSKSVEADQSGEQDSVSSYNRMKAAANTVFARYTNLKGYKANMIKLNSQYLALKFLALPALVEGLRVGNNLKNGNGFLGFFLGQDQLEKAFVAATENADKALERIGKLEANRDHLLDIFNSFGGKNEIDIDGKTITKAQVKKDLAAAKELIKKANADFQKATGVAQKAHQKAYPKASLQAK